MSYWGIHFRVLALATLGSSLVHAQEAETPTVTVCELLANSLAYSGLRVRVAGRLHGVVLYARVCALDLHFGGRQWPVAIRVAATNATVESELRTLWANSNTPYGPSHDLIVELAGTFEDTRREAGATPDGTRVARPLVGRLRVDAVISSRQERPKALSICEVMANPSRYHNRVIAIEGEHRWLGGDQILYDAKCGPVGGSVLTPAPEDPIESEPPRDTPLDVRRSKVEFIAKGRFEAWQAGVEGFDSSRKGFGKCGCYQGRLTFFSFAYFTLSLAEPNK